MNYQGKLTGMTGIGVNDTVDIVFGIYDSPGSSIPMCSDSVISIPITKGLFDAWFNADLDGEELRGDLFLEVKVEGNVMIPRIPVTYNMLAMRAIYADTAVFADSAGFVGSVHWDTLNAYIDTTHADEFVHISGDSIYGDIFHNYGKRSVWFNPGMTDSGWAYAADDTFHICSTMPLKMCMQSIIADTNGLITATHSLVVGDTIRVGDGIELGGVYRYSWPATNWDTLQAYMDTTDRPVWADSSSWATTTDFDTLKDFVSIYGDTIKGDLFHALGARSVWRSPDGADSSWIYNDGDTVRMSSNIPIKMCMNSLIIDPGGTIKTTHDLIVGDTLRVGDGIEMAGVYLANWSELWDTLAAFIDTSEGGNFLSKNGDTISGDFVFAEGKRAIWLSDVAASDSTWMYSSLDTFRMASTKPIKIGNSSLIVERDGSVVASANANIKGMLSSSMGADFFSIDTTNYALNVHGFSDFPESKALNIYGKSTFNGGLTINAGINDGESFGTAGQFLMSDGYSVHWDYPTASVPDPLSVSSLFVDQIGKNSPAGELIDFTAPINIDRYIRTDTLEGTNDTVWVLDVLAPVTIAVDTIDSRIGRSVYFMDNIDVTSSITCTDISLQEIHSSDMIISAPINLDSLYANKVVVDTVTSIGDTIYFLKPIKTPGVPEPALWMSNATNSAIHPSNMALNVGVGTDTPNAKLGVYDATSPVLRIFGPSDISPMISLSSDREWLITNDGSSMWGPADNFNIVDLGTEQTRLIIDLEGKVGIGTTFPTEKFEVIGNARIDGDLYITGTVISAETLFYRVNPEDFQKPDVGILGLNATYAFNEGSIEPLIMFAPIHISDGAKLISVISNWHDGVLDSNVQINLMCDDGVLADLSSYDAGGVGFIDLLFETPIIVKNDEFHYYVEVNIAPGYSTELAIKNIIIKYIK
ncbi:hypothetical protein KAH81_01305 [bacterium]|nr:hypothetical protein [bacterium]